MSFEYFGKYKLATRKDTFPTINEPVVVLLGMTIADLVVTVLSFLVMTLAFNAPFLGLLAGIACAQLRKAYAKKFPRGTFLHFIWSLGLLPTRRVPRLISRAQTRIYSP